MLNSINQYKLDTHLNDYPEGSFIPFFQEQYNFFEEYLGIKRQFKGEEFYYPKNQIFLGRECSNSIIATIDNTIYKIYFHFHVKNENDFIALRESIIDHLNQYIPYDTINNPEVQEVPPDSKLVMWRFDWGNLIFEISSGFDTSYIITSSRVRHAKPIGFFDKLVNKQ